ncbi:MAG: mechanosensitive ion channel [Thermoleophilia bacterium]|nr:mechanosensitive ion channel [Thermoleophilia bacterium]MDH3724406.1 mechanosensitive ion channel [Thermoleophilia bacterium]
MSEILDSSSAVWAIVIIIFLPALIIAFGEISERLRQRQSPFQQAVATVRTSVLPILAVWLLVVFGFDADPENAAVRWLATALLVAGIVAGAQLARALSRVSRSRSRDSGARPLPELLLFLPRLAIVLVGAWLVFVEVWGFDLSGLAAALGVSALVVSLALQSTLSGLASGVLLVSDRPFSPGDWIKVGDIEGRVIDVSWRSTRIHDRNGDLLVVENSKLAGDTIVNYDEPTRVHRVVVPVQVAYSNAPTRAKEMLLAAAAGTPGVLADPPPDIRVVQIDDPLMGYEAHLWVDDFTIAPQVSSDFGSLVWYQSHRLGVPLPSPAFDLYQHDPIQEAADAELTSEDLAQRIRRAPILAELSDEDIERLASDSRAVTYARGETILADEAETRDLFAVWQGLARMTVPGSDGEGLGIVDLGAGDVFGLTGRSPQYTTPAIVAASDCEIIVISAETAGAVTSRNPELAKAINQLAVARQRRLERVHAGPAGASASAFPGRHSGESGRGDLDRGGPT